MPFMAQKLFVQEEDLINDSFRLGVEIFNSGFRPTFIVGLWRGGSSVGIYVQECLQHLGNDTDHIAVRTSYSGMKDYPAMVADPGKKIRVHGTQYLLETLNQEDRLLLVDDVSGSGLTLNAVKQRLQSRLKRNMPDEVRTATIWYKPDHSKTAQAPDYYVHETDRWLVLPYELQGLSDSELEQHKPLVFRLQNPS